MQPGQRVEMSIEDYRAELLSLVSTIGATETVWVPDAAGRVLADDQRALGPVPGDRISAMDGYALRWSDLDAGIRRFQVVADVPAGSPLDPSTPPGSCVQIMTGAPVPSDLDTVVPVEMVSENALWDGAEITVNRFPRRGRGDNVRPVGGELAAGDLVASAGTLVTAPLVGALLGAGIETVLVRRRPRVAVANTGDELVNPGVTRARGQVWESNGQHLAAACRRLGAEVSAVVRLPDDVTVFATELDALCADADLVILTGGASIGHHDVARLVLAQQKKSAFRHIQMRPGRPEGWAVWNGVPVMSLPGNPGAAAVAFALFARPVIEKLAGARRRRFLDQAVALPTSEWRSPAGRAEVLGVALSTDAEGQLRVTPLAKRGSHHVTLLAQADALAIVPAEVTEVLETTPLRLWALE